MPQPNTAEPSAPAEPEPVTRTRVLQYQLEKEEEDFLIASLQHFHDATPRSIRVYTIRYRLGQNLLEKIFGGGAGSGPEWHDGFELKKYFAWKLIQYGHGRKPREIDTTLRWLEAQADPDFLGRHRARLSTLARR